MYSEHYNLLKEWCESLLRLQVVEIKQPGLYGGIMCPACSRIHGRCADAVYPLMYMAHATGEKRYLQAAVRLMDWSEHVSCPDGSWINEPECLWKGITVFSTLSLGEAIRHHGNLLDNEHLVSWLERLKKGANFIYETFSMDTGLINYPITASAALTVAGTVLGDSAFIDKGREFACRSLEFFTENQLIFGEGSPKDGYSPRGCRPVDLGYNVEESLPALVVYGLLTKDEKVLQIVTKSLRQHMEFMLPDGAWDNSWGTRDFKWTYWGSRTSDGCQTAYDLMAEHDPSFAEAARRNVLLLKSCTHDGMLYGGPHYHIKGEYPCIHHTFCHAKALAAVLDYRGTTAIEIPASTLPREAASGIREYPEINTWLIALGPWRGTVTSYDFEYMKEGHPSGGALSMLWHNEAGPVLAASLSEYSMREPANMQRVKDSIDMSLTPRLELVQQDGRFKSINDYSAAVEYRQQDGEIWFRSKGKLVNGDQQNPCSGEVGFSMEYVFRQNSFEILVKGNFENLQDELRYYIPVVSDRTEQIIQTGGNTMEICKMNKKLNIRASLPINMVECSNNRVFNHVPGFEAVPLYLSLNSVNECKIIID